MSDLLNKIVSTKKIEIQILNKDPLLLEALSEIKKGHIPQPQKQRDCSVSPPSFKEALFRPNDSPIRVIAESKKASPSMGLIRNNYDSATNAETYKKLGAAAMSVLTDRDYFQGRLEDLSKARISGLPLIRKDFILSNLQIIQAKLTGASAVLLIISILRKDQLQELYTFAKSIELDVLVETHSEAEIQIALDLKSDIIGINHRNLDTLEMDLTLTPRMSPAIRQASPQTIIVAESGIENPEGVKLMDPFADAILIGSALMKSSDISKAWQNIFS